MICSKCGKTVSDNVKFCGYCGEKVILPKPPEIEFRFCMNCGTKLLDNAKFCHKCGKQVGGKVLYADTSKSNTVAVNQRTVNNIVKNEDLKRQVNETKEKAANVFEANSFIRNWLFTICGIVSILALFFPVLDYGFFSISLKDIFNIADFIDDSTALVVGLFLLIYIPLAIGLIACKNVMYIRIMSLGGTGLLLIVRILPNIIIGSSVNSELGFGYGVSYLQYGIGWWLMLLPFVAAAIVSWVLSDKLKKVK